MARDLARLAALVCWVALLGCDQYALVGVRETEVDDTGAPPAPQDAASPSAPDASSPGAPDAALFMDASTDAGDDPAACLPPDGGTVQVCDPIKNDVCSAAVGMHCTVDQLQYLVGYCIFTSPTPPQLGGDCLNAVGVTDSCGPTTLCYGTQCRKVCFCDAHCGAGQCCNQPIDGTGFSVCSDC